MIFDTTRKNLAAMGSWYAVQDDNLRVVQVEVGPLSESQIALLRSGDTAGLGCIRAAKSTCDDFKHPRVRKTDHNVCSHTAYHVPPSPPLALYVYNVKS